MQSDYIGSSFYKCEYKHGSSKFTLAFKMEREEVDSFWERDKEMYKEGFFEPNFVRNTPLSLR